MPWDEWKNMGLRIYAATAGQGFDLFDDWSQRSSKYDAENTIEAWEQIQASPPTRTGAGVLRRLAQEHGWTPRLFECAPTHAASESEIAAARRQLWAHNNNFWERTDNFHTAEQH
jgi:hypothetical protein